MKNFYLLILVSTITLSNNFAQEISYSDLSIDESSLKSNLQLNNSYYKGGSVEYPYFQGKENHTYIKFHRSTGTVCTIDFSSKQEFIGLINEIRNKANFKYKFNTNVREPVVYNYITKSGNKLRFDLEEMRISVEYPSVISTLIHNNSGITPVFVCQSQEAYAFHTNLQCEGLQNCEDKIAKSNITEAKKYNYRFCEICTEDNN